MAEVNTYDNSLSKQSATAAQPPKEENRAVVSKAATTKTSKMKKLKNQIFVSSAKDVSKTFWEDNILPGIKHAIVAAINKWFFGNDQVVTMNGVNRIQRSLANTIQINNQNTQKAVQPSQTVQNAQKMFDTVFVYGSADDARSVIDVLLSTGEKYGKVRVSDMYEFSSISFEPQWQNWGWSYSDLTHVAPRFNPVDRQWYVEMPAAKPFNQL